MKPTRPMEIKLYWEHFSMTLSDRKMVNEPSVSSETWIVEETENVEKAYNEALDAYLKKVLDITQHCAELNYVKYRYRVHVTIRPFDGFDNQTTIARDIIITNL